MRIYVSDRKFSYIFSFYGFIDLIAIAPFYLSGVIDLRSLRVVRLLRILKLFRFNEDSWRKKRNQVTDLDYLYRLAYCGVKCGYLDQKLVYQLPRNDSADIGWEAAMNDYNQFIEN